MKVAIYGQYYKNEDKLYVEELFETLRNNNIKFVIEESYFLGLKDFIEASDSTTFSSYKDLNEDFDFMITIGGDGTILRAITLIRDSNIPIIGINTGRLGFLATVKKERISFMLNLLLKNQYKIREHSLLDVSLSSSNKTIGDVNFALNEVSVSRKNTASMITIKTYLNEDYLSSYWADGLIISTPTGSTGYSLSCGGPIITPESKNFVITPIAPHNLNARPLVITDDTEIKFSVTGREDSFFLSLDSRIITIRRGTEIIIKKADVSIKMVDFNQQTFYYTLREKLLWGQDTRN